MRCARDRSGFLTCTEIDLTLEALVLAVFADQEGLDNAHICPIVVLEVALWVRSCVENLGIQVEFAVKQALIPDVPLLLVLSALPRVTLADVPAHRSARGELEGTILALEHFSLFPFYLLVIFVLLNLLI